MEEVLIDIDIQKEMHTVEGRQLLEVKLKIPRQGFVSLFGKSGAGKTTILRIIAGLTKPDSGRIVAGGKVWFDNASKIDIKSRERSIGFVFQDYALFPNMTVKQQLEYARGEKDESYITELLNTFDLFGLSGSKPALLSGGQKQRLAVARALARKPEILLLDEPLSALDQETRQILQKEIISIHRKFHTTTLMVSHDINEILYLSDYVYKIDSGKIIKSGSAGDVLDGQEQKISARVHSASGGKLSIIYSDENDASGREILPGDEIFIIKRKR